MEQGQVGQIARSLGYSTGAVAGNQIEQPPSPPISAALERATKAAAYLHDRISLLEQRLVMVLGPTRPADASSSKEVTRATLAAAISLHAGTIDGACYRLDDLISRLEL